MTDAVGHQARQVFDLPQPLRVTEHRAHECRCGKSTFPSRCGSPSIEPTNAAAGNAERGQFPDAVTVQYGPNVAATVAYLSAYIPEDRIARLPHDLHRIDISAASIAAMLHRKAFELAGFADAGGQGGGGQAWR